MVRMALGEEALFKPTESLRSCLLAGKALIAKIELNVSVSSGCGVRRDNLCGMLSNPLAVVERFV